mmetsp:Transcript_27185/g.78120  ORF Transcript_27185/g.78120 Transcript_27185/m.78120 type:complete len:379 (+) Transcript_27185:43-1179(+)
MDSSGSESGYDTESSEDAASGFCGFGRPADRGLLEVPLPDGKPDLRHWILPPTGHFWSNRRRNHLHVRHWLPPATAIRGTVFWLHGYAGHMNSRHTVRYPERLCQDGYAVLAFECEGHGYSPGERCFIRSFDDVLDDAVDFIALVFNGEASAAEKRRNLGIDAAQLAAMHRGRFAVLGESMGGALALLTALRIQNGGLDETATSKFGGALVCAPALAVSLPPPVVQALLRNLVVPLVPSSPMPSFVSKNSQNDKALMLRDPDLVKLVEMDDFGEAKGALGWHKPMKWATAGAFSKLYSTLDDDMRAMSFPILVLHDPGDGICKIDGARRLMQLSPSGDKRLVEVPGGLHDLTVNEPDVVHRYALDFFASHLCAAPAAR